MGTILGDILCGFCDSARKYILRSVGSSQTFYNVNGMVYG
jgi:hypothetical protein